jgi:hypothetical protein
MKIFEVLTEGIIIKLCINVFIKFLIKNLMNCHKKLFNLYYEMIAQIFNFYIGCYGCFMIASSLYLWFQTNTFNTFIFFEEIYSYFCILVTLNGCYMKSSKSIFIYFILNLILVIINIFFIIGIYIFKDDIVNMLLINRKDVESQVNSNISTLKLISVGNILIEVF